jgi:hypothetical protein
MSATDAGNGAFPRVPAPWRLHGQGYILALWLPRRVLDGASFLPPELGASRRGNIAWAMFADYAAADVGPYRELLFIPGSVRFSDARRRSISRIFVSSEASAANARRNWGIPKECCDFRVRYGADRVDEVALARGGREFVRLRLRHYRPRVPLNGAWMPARLRTLGQLREGREYSYTPAATGHVAPARLLSAYIDPGCFPDIGAGRVVLALKATDFDLVFPAARVRRPGAARA